MVENKSFLTKDNTQVFYKIWLPQNNQPVAILQIIHGMAEYIDRYNEFAEYLNKKNICVYAHDQRGHGQTGLKRGKGNYKEAKMGFLAPKNGWKLLVEDAKQMTEIIKKDFPNTPLFILGHSMGSLVLRSYLLTYKEYPKGVIISGTTWGNKTKLLAGIALSNILSLINGKSKHSRTLTKITFAGFNGPFYPLKTKYDWLSRDHERNQNYTDDPLCGFYCSNNFFKDLSKLVLFASNSNKLVNIPKEIPMFLICGSMDPVGEFGKGVQKVFNIFTSLGVNDLKMKMYEGGRHEMLNEINRQEVFEDIFNWINLHNN